MFKDILEKVINRQDLSEEEMIDIMNSMMNGELEEAQTGAFLVALRMKGETEEEITGAAKVMRDKAKTINVKKDSSVDTVGTGGDKSNTFNISTISAIIAASAGATVVKHGNRSVSSKCGSADALEALGINLSMSVENIEKCVNEVGMGFLFAPEFHSSMKNAIGPRKKLGVRTIFNILGPITNPARVENQIMGVFDESLTEVAANVLKNLGVKRALVVHGMDGLDEITTTADTKISELINGEIKTYYINSKDFNMQAAKSEDLVGGDAKENAQIIKDILNGEKGPKRDIAILNTAAVLYVTGGAASIEEGIKLSNEAIDSGKALNKLNELIEFSKECK